jgi:GAF domain-containing protein
MVANHFSKIMSNQQGAPLPSNEAERLKALAEYEILDTDAERHYDDITFIASTICGVPISTMTLIDKERQWFKAKVGLESKESPREQAFCGFTILQTAPLVVADAQKDERCAKNPLVTGDPKIRFYAGVPLINPQGFALGALCVIDRKPRTLDATQTRALEALGRQIISQLE